MSTRALGRFSFVICTVCIRPDLHGYVTDPDGNRIAGPFATKPEVVKEVESLLGVEGGIPADQKVAVMADIDASGLGDTIVRAPARRGEGLGDLLAALLGGPAALPEPSDKDGRKSFRLDTPPGVVPATGSFRDEIGRVLLDGFITTTAATEQLRTATEYGLVTPAEIPLIEEDIRASGLPEKEPYIGPFTIETDFGPSGVVGAFIGGGGNFSLGSAFASKSEARERLTKGIEDGLIMEDERQTLLDQIEASELEESAPMAAAAT